MSIEAHEVHLDRPIAISTAAQAVINFELTKIPSASPSTQPETRMPI